MKKPISLAITKFKYGQNREKDALKKLIICNDIPNERYVAENGIVHYLKRLGGQVTQMYSLLDYEYKPGKVEEPISELSYIYIKEPIAELSYIYIKDTVPGVSYIYIKDTAPKISYIYIKGVDSGGGETEGGENTDVNKGNFILLDIPKIESALQNDSIQYFGFVVPWYGTRTHPTLVYWSKHWLEGIKTAEEVALIFLGYLQAEYFRYLSPIDVGLYNSPIYCSGWEADLTIVDMGVYNLQGDDLRQLLLEAIGQEHITLHKLAEIGNHPDVTPCSTTIYKNDSKALYTYDDYDNFDASKLKYQGVFGTDTGDNLIFDMWQAIVSPSDNRYVASYLGKLNWTPIGIDANGNYTMTFK